MPCSWAAMMPRLTPGLRPKSSAFTMSCLFAFMAHHPTAAAQWRWYSTDLRRRETSQIGQQAAQDRFGAEILLGESAGGPAVFTVVGPDRVEGRQDVLHRGKGEQALAGREHVAEARVLGD